MAVREPDKRKVPVSENIKSDDAVHRDSPRHRARDIRGNVRPIEAENSSGRCDLGESMNGKIRGSISEPGLRRAGSAAKKHSHSLVVLLRNDEEVARSNRKNVCAK